MEIQFFKGRRIVVVLIAILFLGVAACKDDDDDDDKQESKTYTLNQVGESGVVGTAKFDKLSNGYTRITVQLTGTSEGDSHPMHIHNNSVSEGGGIAISLTPVSGNNGTSVTEVTQLDNGTAISYDQLLVFDGYINVHLSATEMGTIVAQGNIGQNAP